MVFHAVHLITLYAVPVLVFKSIGVEIGVLESIVSTALVMLVANFIPIPGATGGVEYGFMQFFGKFSAGALLSSGMLLWRFATYFFGLIIGGVALILKKGGSKE